MFFFGLGELAGVLLNPAESLRSLSEARKTLEGLRLEMQQNKEKASIPVAKTFSRLPGFFPRPNEIKALERSLSGIPSFLVLFGASSCGKTALLREVLADDRYHVLHFDLRIAGFADLSSLYFCLAEQIEQYFASIPEMMRGEDGESYGWELFEREGWRFKHDRLGVQKRVEAGGEVKSSDIAHLMELLQSSLLKYWEFEPTSPGSTNHTADATEISMKEGLGGADDLIAARTVDTVSLDGSVVSKEEEDAPQPNPKKIPVFLIDEAHKLPALIRSPDSMKTLLDSMLVLTKQDRLMHVLHATSDPFYMHWLRNFNVMQHCKIVSIGDCSKVEAREYYTDLLRHVPDELKKDLSFEEVYRVFGGKLAHINDYITEYVNAEGDMIPERSSHFLQAHALLNLHLIHATPEKSSSNSPFSETTGEGFPIYSPLLLTSSSSPDLSASVSTTTTATIRSNGAEFSATSLLAVMKRLAPRALPTNPRYSTSLDEIGEISYFALCREIGAGEVDGFVRGRILELRWSETVTEEGETRNGRRRERGVGPVLVPTTPVVRYAMATVLKEYDMDV